MNDGVTFAPNSGADDAFEGVQNFDGLNCDDWYYHPDDDLDTGSGPAEDRFKRDVGFPPYPGLREAAIEEYPAGGIGMPWYQTYGNHDLLVQSDEHVNDLYAEIAVGGAGDRDVELLLPAPLELFPTPEREEERRG